MGEIIQKKGISKNILRSKFNQNKSNNSPLNICKVFLNVSKVIVKIIKDPHNNFKGTEKSVFFSILLAGSYKIKYFIDSLAIAKSILEGRVPRFLQFRLHLKVPETDKCGYI